MHSFERYEVQRSQRMENENNPENVPVDRSDFVLTFIHTLAIYCGAALLTQWRALRRKTQASTRQT